MDDDMESGNLGPYKDRPRTFPNMRSKPYTPLVRTISRYSMLSSLFCRMLSFLFTSNQISYCVAYGLFCHDVLIFLFFFNFRSRETFLLSAMRLVVVLSDVKGWKCIADDNLHDAKIAMKDLIDFMGSKKSGLYNYVRRYMKNWMLLFLCKLKSLKPSGRGNDASSER
ncbi:hypothetical protein RHGRI_007216 [Rhododendron griersonianum]|uniref:Uncharacterized protein n=1 Tax=Rhododendron griersonianum TaxID=479676 RepID=A0AAV6KX96_9ERIC|nr:hypothetical protein RHGRI_007216 [Rhododendron griersonianum]